MSVEFIWQGSHELLVELSKPKHIGLVHFFFGTRYLDNEWFKARLAEAHAAAGPRYTPELNVQLTLSQDFDAFCRTHEFFNRVRSKARSITDRIRSHAFSITKYPDSNLQSKLTAAESACSLVLAEFRGLAEDPVQSDPLADLRDALHHASSATGDLLSEYWRQRQAEEAKQELCGASASKRQGSDHSYLLRELNADLRGALSHLDQIRDLTTSNLVVLIGKAGSGKTHLLCDLAKKRLDQGRPTVVLMGQRFLEASDPWVQALQQLDLADWSAKELVDALEVVARRANSRVLFVIDAINEGVGRQLWPVHLSPFLARLKASPWINTILSVRSSYAEDILPESVATAAAWIDHPGFDGVEFDATRVFFEHFGIDLPSTPLLAPEFSNPLYLKTLCQGLHVSRETRLPRGFHGVVQAFSKYLAGINKKAARDLDYDSRSDLVEVALKDLASHMVETSQQWLSYPRAESVVNAHLPGRGHSRSLLTKLLGEGVLIEEKAWSSIEKRSISVVQIAYERLSDFLCAEAILDQHLDVDNPAAAFQVKGPLAPQFLRTTWSRPGLHEALHILVAERTGQELVDLVPALAEEYLTQSVFLSSIVWRSPDAVTPRALSYLRSLKATSPAEVIDTLITLATIPSHPVNANFTDSLLRETCMAERDSWWTLGLNGLWGQKSAVDRLVQWANHVWPDTSLDDQSASLAACIIAWLLPSSNRFLRDHATKALVRVLTWRPLVVEQLIERFCEIDDAYVVERVLAAAYGATMRTTDAVGVTAIANVTYAKVFAAGRPRPHLLLREYAQGIVKRAKYLQNEPSSALWPKSETPYASDWPKIPTQSEIDAVAPGWSEKKTASFSWGRDRIRSSVMDDDFGRYVIGTNSWSTNWLSLRLDEPQWMSLDFQIERAVSTLSEVELDAWKLLQEIAGSIGLEQLPWRWRVPQEGHDGQKEATTRASSTSEQLLVEIREAFLALVGDERRAAFSALIDTIACDSRMRTQPKFDLRLVQRYIVGRVFELGWTSERFDQFDQTLRGGGRDAAKPERIGKKYQWIAYHEILAYMADHYQYAAGTAFKEIGTAYKGSWQDRVRDIDPSNVMLALRSNEGDTFSLPPFWVPAGVDGWHSDVPAHSWAQTTTDIPLPSNLLFSRDDGSGSEWISMHSTFKWSMPRPAYEDSFRDGRREVWMHADGALIKREDIGKLKTKEVSLAIMSRGSYGSGLHKIFLGEIGWSDASKFFEDPYYAHQGWAAEVDPDLISVIAVSQGYTRERGSFDCSVTSETISLRVPTERMLALLGSHWSGISATYVNASGVVVAFDPSANVPGPSALLLRKESLQEVLHALDLVVCWRIVGEKTDAQGSPGYHVNARRSFQGIFLWDGEKLTGSYLFDKVES